MKAVSEMERWATDTALTTFMDISEMILITARTGNAPDKFQVMNCQVSANSVKIYKNMHCTSNFKQWEYFSEKG